MTGWWRRCRRVLYYVALLLSMGLAMVGIALPVPMVLREEKRPTAVVRTREQLDARS